MFIKYSILLTTTIIASSFSLLAQAESSNFDQIFVFGNSVSDAGNVYGITGSTFPPSPLYYEGRFSNGQIWIDYLGEDLELNPSTFYSDSFTDAEDGINFAIGGATTGTNSLGDSPNISFPGVTTQVNDFINFLDGETISEDALVILWAGENDYVEAFQNSGTLINPAIPINNIANSLSQLADAGAKHILVPNLINLANTPLGRSFIPPEQLDRLTLLTNAHNNALNSAVDSLDKSLTETDFAILDVNSLLENIFENPLDFGFQENPLESCLSPNNFPDISPGVVPCENP
ncbi:SGNH/GDSL hydrolase family protein, partial [Hyella patelloides]|uniref:SGNH/GDSL hydrolase family protein n=1 Tax=Hyella patelloides TaxID=1982969 RepID=UPI00119CB7E1